MATHIIIPIEDIEQRYKELNSNRGGLSEYWLGVLHGYEQVFKHHKAKEISLDEKDIEEKANSLSEKLYQSTYTGRMGHTAFLNVAKLIDYE